MFSYGDMMAGAAVGDQIIFCNAHTRGLCSHCYISSISFNPAMKGGAMTHAGLVQQWEH